LKNSQIEPDVPKTAEGILLLNLVEIPYLIFFILRSFPSFGAAQEQSRRKACLPRAK